MEISQWLQRLAQCVATSCPFIQRQKALSHEVQTCHYAGGKAAGDADMLVVIRHNNFKAGKKLMGVDGKHLQVNDRARVPIFYISP